MAQTTKRKHFNTTLSHQAWNIQHYQTKLDDQFSPSKLFDSVVTGQFSLKPPLQVCHHINTNLGSWPPFLFKPNLKSLKSVKIVGKDKNLASFKIVGYLGGAAPQPFREAPIAVPQSKTSVGREFVHQINPPSIHIYRIGWCKISKSLDLLFYY